MKFAISPNGIFNSLQGEGHLQGFRQTFIRLAGCSNARLCGASCDTDFSKARTLTLEEIVAEARAVMPAGDRDEWIWVTGGEPADLPQAKQIALISALKAEGWSVCVATSGSKRFIPPVDWLSVSPHSCEPELFQQRYGNEVKLVDGLGGLDLNEWADRWDSVTDYLYRYVQPLSRFDGARWVEDEESFARCLDFLRANPRWALSQQRHHQWGLA